MSRKNAISKIRLVGAAILSLAALPLAAQAADMPIKAPIYKALPVLAPSWAGFYVGINGGYGWGHSTVDVIGDPTTLAVFGLLKIPTSVSTSPKGFLGGVQAGYNWQWNKLVYGIEGDFDLAAIKGSGSSSGGPGVLFNNVPLVFTNAATQKLDMFSTVRGRLGYTIWDPFLIYGTGGLAFGHAKLDTTLSNNFGGMAAGSDSKWLVGWTLGAGAEYMISRSWTIKGEYLYYNLGKIEASIPLGAAVTETVSAPVKGNIVRLGLNYKF